MNIYATRKGGYEWMSLDDFEDMLPDRPADQKWELINGRVIRAMVGTRWEHHVIMDNMGHALSNHLIAKAMPADVAPTEQAAAPHPDPLPLKKGERKFFALSDGEGWR